MTAGALAYQATLETSKWSKVDVADSLSRTGVAPRANALAWNSRTHRF